MSLNGYFAMMRDASWYANPGRAAKYHIAVGSRVASCNPSIQLSEHNSIRISKGNMNLVCKRCVKKRGRP